jgi:hypothetical protein
MDRGVGWVCFLFFLFFSKPFQTNFKPFLNQFFTQISPTIYKGFSQTLLSTFQTYFKFKPLPFNSSFYTNFHKLFHNYFKTFKTTSQPKLMHFNMMHKHLIDSNFIQNDI